MSVSSHRRGSTSARLPRAGVDPIACIEDALAMFELQRCHPIRAETLAMFLDSSGCGSVLVTVTDTVAPAQLLEVAEVMARLGGARPEISGLVLATVRPRYGLQTGDDELWTRAVEIVEANGLDLIDWFVISRHGTSSPRELLGQPSRWAR